MARNAHWREEWLALGRSEPILEPGRPIVDPHHHLLPAGHPWHYDIIDLEDDVATGHRIVQTVFIECRAAYRTEGPDELKPVGETEFAAAQAAQSARAPKGALIGGIVASADLRLGARVEPVLEAHLAAGRGLLRGIRDLGAWDGTGSVRINSRSGEAHYYARPDVKAGAGALGRFGLVCDLYCYQPQLDDVLDLARACPEIRFVLDHYGTPIGIGTYAGRKDEVFAAWRKQIAAIGACPNVVMKIGGLTMPHVGLGFEARSVPPSSEDVAAAERPYFAHALESFGPDRLMFESNFPVDRESVSYPVLWNAFKRLASGLSETEKDALFRKTATTVYRLAP